MRLVAKGKRRLLNRRSTLETVRELRRRVAGTSEGAPEPRLPDLGLHPRYGAAARHIPRRSRLTLLVATQYRPRNVMNRPAVTYEQTFADECHELVKQRSA